MKRYEGGICDYENWTVDWPEVTIAELDPSFVTQGKNGKFMHEEVDRYVHENPTPLLLDRGFYQELTKNDTYLIAGVQFEVEEEWAVGREDSLHQVQFGWLHISRSDDETTKVGVAIKPFYGSRQLLVNELAATLKAPELTGIRSFNPIGIVETPGGLATITLFEEEVESLDNFKWNRDIHGELIDEIGTVHVLQLAALTLARIHSSGVVHNDAQVKNLAVVPRIEEDDYRFDIRLIDLEHATWHDPTDPIDYIRFIDGVRRDTAKFMTSVLEKGLWREAGYDDRAEALKGLFIEPYLSITRHPGAYNPTRPPELLQDIERVLSDILKDI